MEEQLTAEEMADHLRIKIYEYLQIEHGTYFPPVDVAYRLSKLLGTPIEKLFFPQDVTDWLEEVN